MRLLDVQPKKNFSYIFVQFPGMKMNVPMLSKQEGKAVKEDDVALCVQLNNKEKVHNLYLVRTQSIKPFDFTDEIGPKAAYRVIKKKETSQDSLTNLSDGVVTHITDEVAIVQKQTETGCQFVLLFNHIEIGVIASVEEELLPVEKVSSQHKEEANEPVAFTNKSKKNKAALTRMVKKKIFIGGKAFQFQGVFETIRIISEEVKRKVALFSPAAFEFIGPGDFSQTTFSMEGG